MRVLVLYNGNSGADHEIEAVETVCEVAAEVQSACRAGGWEASSRVAPDDPPSLYELVRQAGADVVFNLIESWRAESRLEAAAAWVLEVAGVAYTGAPPLALSLGLDKPLCKQVLRGSGLRVARGCVVKRGDEPLDGLCYPCVVKPACEDASHGISADSLVHDPETARARGQALARALGTPALVEEFVPGREYNVSILGTGDDARALPLSQIDYATSPHLPPLLTYAAKWDESSPEYALDPAPVPDLEPVLAARIRAVALAAYREIGLRDYGRVDIRLDHDGEPVVLEVNPNPSLGSGDGLSRAAARAGIPYPDLVRRIVGMARARHDASP